MDEELGVVETNHLLALNGLAREREVVIVTIILPVNMIL